MYTSKCYNNIYIYMDFIKKLYTSRYHIDLWEQDIIIEPIVYGIGGC